MSGALRLVLVELRRATDTRAPRWAFAISILIGVSLGMLARDPERPDFADVLGGGGLVLPLVMGLLAVMTFTADWSTRAALVTFTLSPRRSRVLWARYAAVLTLAVGTLVSMLALTAALFILVEPSAPATVLTPKTFALTWSVLATTVAATLTATAIASLLLRTALSLLVAVFGPFVLTIGLALNAVLVEWFNPYGFATWLSQPTVSWRVHDGTGVGPAVVSLVVWTVVPLVLGWRRQIRTEPR